MGYVIRNVRRGRIGYPIEDKVMGVTYASLWDDDLDVCILKAPLEMCKGRLEVLGMIN